MRAPRPLPPPRRRLALSCLLLSALGACGDSGGSPTLDDAAGTPDADGARSPGDPVFADAGRDPVPIEPTTGEPTGGASVTTPAPLLVIESDPARIAAVPTLVAVETLADSGLQVAYTEASQRARIEPLRVGVQWQHMQGCTGIVASPPLVLIRVEVEPFVDTDDTLRDFEGRVSASASEPIDGVAILQVRDAPFDGSRPDAGFGLLRQIMGRHLWLSAGLLERLYPSECARRVPPEPLPDPRSPAFPENI